MQAPGLDQGPGNRTAYFTNREPPARRHFYLGRQELGATTPDCGWS